MTQRRLLSFSASMGGLLLIILFMSCHRPTPRLQALPATGSLAATIERLHTAYARDGRLYAIEDHDVMMSTDSGRTFRRIAQLPKRPDAGLGERLRNLVARHHLVRLVRKGASPSNVVVLASGTVLVFWDAIYRISEGSVTIHDYPTRHQPFPSSVGVAVGRGDTVYYGEYQTVDRSPEVAIVRGTDDGRRWEAAYTFPAGEIFHIHSISWDPFRNGFWVATGDRGAQVRLLFSGDAFATLRTVGCCAQSWRIVDLIVTDTHLVWGSDDDESSPGIYRYDVAKDTLERVADLDNPSYHAALLSDGAMVVTTTFEPGSRYSAESNASASASLWYSTDGISWDRRLSLAGDTVAIAENRRPTIRLPNGDPLPVLLMTPMDTREHAFSTVFPKR